MAAPVLQELATQADLRLVGLAEAQELWGLETAAQLRSHLSEAGEVGVRDGDNEATWLDPAPEIFAPAPAVDVVEVVCAGDAFAAGLLAARLGGHGLDRQLANGHRFAERALSSVAEFRSLPAGERPSVPAMAEPFNVSRNPVRGAVLRLVQDGFAQEMRNMGGAAGLSGAPATLGTAGRPATPPDAPRSGCSHRGPRRTH